jgi:hypothetical protein
VEPVVKFCVDCKYIVPSAPTMFTTKPIHYCSRQDFTTLNLVTGKNDLFMVRETCERERSSNKRCGPGARFFKEKVC